MAVLGVLLLAPAVRAGEPDVHLPKLDGGRVEPVPAPPADEAPARRLPPTVAVCQDRGAGRCWVAARERDCRTAEVPTGEIFRVVIDDAGEASTALADCRATLARATTP